jgi:hypothetical protein
LFEELNPTIIKVPAINFKIQLQFNTGGGRGDPHFVTLDGLEFTFNGYGEFVFLKVAQIDFQVQVSHPGKILIDFLMKNLILLLNWTIITVSLF